MKGEPMVDVNEIDATEIDRAWNRVRSMIHDCRIRAVMKKLNTLIRDTRPLQELVACPEQQLVHVKGWSEVHAWGLSEADFLMLPPPPPRRTGNDPIVTVLCYGDDDPLSTLG